MVPGRRRLAAVLAATLISLSSVTMSSANSPIPTVDEVDQLSIELQFRRDFGLNSDPEFVKQLMADATAYDGNYGVALTLDELSDLQGVWRSKTRLVH